MNCASSSSSKEEHRIAAVSPKQALSQKWVIGRGWVNRAELEEEEKEDAIREAMKGDDQFQLQQDES